jgi:hypothetical protein
VQLALPDANVGNASLASAATATEVESDADLLPPTVAPSKHKKKAAPQVISTFTFKLNDEVTEEELKACLGDLASNVQVQARRRGRVLVYVPFEGSAEAARAKDADLDFIQRAIASLQSDGEHLDRAPPREDAPPPVAAAKPAATGARRH